MGIELKNLDFRAIDSYTTGEFIALCYQLMQQGYVRLHLTPRGLASLIDIVGAEIDFVTQYVVIQSGLIGKFAAIDLILNPNLESELGYTFEFIKSTES